MKTLAAEPSSVETLSAKAESFPVTDFQKVIDLHNQPIEATIFAYGKNLVFKGRRLTPAESEDIKNLSRYVIPPRTAGTPEKPDYDWDDIDYRKRLDVVRLQARAKVVMLAFGNIFEPHAQAVKADIGTPDKLTAFIQGLNFSDQALENLQAAAVQDPVGLVALTGFSSGNNSPRS